MVFYNIFLVIAIRPLRVSCSLWYYLVGVVAKGYITFAWRWEVMVQTQWWFKTPQRWAFCCAGHRLSLIQQVKFYRLYRCFENQTGPAGWTRYTTYQVEICSGTDVYRVCSCNLFSSRFGQNLQTGGLSSVQTGRFAYITPGAVANPLLSKFFTLPSTFNNTTSITDYTLVALRTPPLSPTAGLDPPLPAFAGVPSSPWAPGS